METSGGREGAEAMHDVQCTMCDLNAWGIEKDRRELLVLKNKSFTGFLWESFGFFSEAGFEFEL